EQTTTHDAPSFRPGALPAVVVPSGSKTGRSAASFSSVVSRRIPSSAATPPTVTISSAKRPAPCAATARSCDRYAHSSCSSLDLLRLQARALERSANREASELGRGHVRKAPSEAPERRSNSGDDDRPGHRASVATAALGAARAPRLGRAQISCATETGLELGW